MLGYLPFTAFMSKSTNNTFIHHVPPHSLHTHTYIQSQASPLLSCHSCSYDMFTDWCPHGYWGNWHSQVPHVWHFLSTVITAHYHMDDVNHDNMQNPMCVVCIPRSFYHCWAPLCTVCLEHTGQHALLSWLLRNMLPHLTAMFISESKYNVFDLFFKKESLRRACAWTFYSCVCVWGEGGGG